MARVCKACVAFIGAGCRGNLQAAAAAAAVERKASAGISGKMMRNEADVLTRYMTS
jgi:hypothetical protein